MKLRCLLAAAVGLVLWTSNAPAVVNHPADDALIGTVPGPASAVVGRWSSSASAVAVAPDYILTTRHQGGGEGTNVVFGGITYVVDQVTNVGTADLRIARITTSGPNPQPANLSAFVPVYTGNDAVPTTFTMAGFGRGRDADLTTTGGTYGYQWLSQGNTTQRSGRNRFEAAGVATAGGFVSDVLIADFDAPNHLTAVPFESIPTEFDSGSGWFVENGVGNWQVAAITRGIGHDPANAGQPFETSLFASNLNAALPAPDVMDAVRLSSYRTFINANIPEPGTLTLLGVAVTLLGLRRGARRPNYCE